MEFSIHPKKQQFGSTVDPHLSKLRTLANLNSRSNFSIRVFCQKYNKLLWNFKKPLTNWLTDTFSLE